MSVCPKCYQSFDSDRALSIHHSKKHGERLNEDEYTEECPTCESSFKTSRGMKMHHSKVHGESLAGEPVECENCGKNKRVAKHKLSECERFFCNKECAGEWRSKNLCGEDHWSYKDTSEVCKYCGEEYHIKESKESTFCSRECQTSWQSENWTGEDAPAWKGGYSDYYGYSWKTRRKDIQERDKNICQNCGYDSDETLDVHHVVPVRTFDDYNDAHFDENMYQLCKDCHLKLEKINPLEQVKILEDDAEADSLERIEEMF
jgi:5-methylcytosine-specific restriction endonuclease McrA/uncharacterized C2H2 Zn-finger protein